MSEEQLVTTGTEAPVVKDEATLIQLVEQAEKVAKELQEENAALKTENEELKKGVAPSKLDCKPHCTKEELKFRVSQASRLSEEDKALLGKIIDLV